MINSHVIRDHDVVYRPVTEIATVVFHVCEGTNRQTGDRGILSSRSDALNELKEATFRTLGTRLAAATRSLNSGGSTTWSGRAVACLGRLATLEVPVFFSIGFARNLRISRSHRDVILFFFRLFVLTRQVLGM